MWYICRHMWYEKLYLTFHYKVVKFHFWTPCKSIFCSHRAKTRPKSVIFVLNGILGSETSWTIVVLAITTFLMYFDTMYLFVDIWKMLFSENKKPMQAQWCQQDINENRFCTKLFFFNISKQLHRFPKEQLIFAKYETISVFLHQFSILRCLYMERSHQFGQISPDIYHLYAIVQM